MTRRVFHTVYVETPAGSLYNILLYYGVAGICCIKDSVNEANAPL